MAAPPSPRNVVEREETAGHVAGARMSSAESTLPMEGLARAAPARRMVLCVLALIVGAGLVLRTTGIGFLLPQLSEPDGVVLDQQVQRLRGDDRLQAPEFIAEFYPVLVARLAAWMPDGEAKPTPARTLDEHLHEAARWRREIRVVVALLSLLAVPGTWWLSRRFVPEAWAVVAAALLATSVFHIWFAQQARPHAAEASFALLAVLAAMHLRRRGGVGAFAIAGIAAGLAIGCLQNGLAVLPALFLAVVLRARKGAEPKKRVVLGSLLALVSIALAVWLCYPSLIDALSTAESGSDGSMLNVSGHIVNLSMFNGRGFATVARSLWEYDPLLAGLAALGLVTAGLDLVRRRSSGAEEASVARRDELWIVLAYVVPYLIAIGMYQRTYQRFALPLVPYECALAAFGMWRCSWGLFRAGATAQRIALAGLALMLSFQGFAAWKLVHVREQPDTIAQAARWVEAHVPRDARVSVMPPLDLPLWQNADGRYANFPLLHDISYPWFTYQLRVAVDSLPGWNLLTMPLATEAMRATARKDPAGFVRDLRAEWIVLEVYSPDRRPLPAMIRNEVVARGELVSRISPDSVDSGEDLPLVYQDDEFPYTTPWFARILHARCVGPVIEIYRMR
jgi:hypothetical protein